MPLLPIRWVLGRDPHGKFEPQELLCTDLTVDPVQILEWCVLRWPLEVTWPEARAPLSLESQRPWNERAIARTTPKIQRQLHESSDRILSQAVDLLQTIPGVGAHVAEMLVSEIGTDMTRFPTAGPLASGADMCPGNHQSAGKQLSGYTCKGNVYVRGPLTQAAWAETWTKHTYLAAQCRRLTTPLG